MKMFYLGRLLPVHRAPQETTRMEEEVEVVLACLDQSGGGDCVHLLLVRDRGVLVLGEVSEVWRAVHFFHVGLSVQYHAPVCSPIIRRDRFPGTFDAEDLEQSLWGVVVGVLRPPGWFHGDRLRGQF